MTRIFTLLFILNCSFGAFCKPKPGFAYWLPKKIIEINEEHPEQQTTTTFGYDEYHRLLSIIRFNSYDHHIATSFIKYDDRDRILEIMETSTNPTIPKSNFRFVYDEGNLIEIQMHKGEKFSKMQVQYNLQNHSYLVTNDTNKSHFFLGENNDLKTILANDSKAIEINTNSNLGLCKDIMVPTALTLIQDQLQTANSMAMLFYQTREVTSILYDGRKLVSEHQYDEYGNIAEVKLQNHPEGIVTYNIEYDHQNIKL